MEACTGEKGSSAWSVAKDRLSITAEAPFVLGEGIGILDAESNFRVGAHEAAYGDGRLGRDEATRKGGRLTGEVLIEGLGKASCAVSASAAIAAVTATAAITAPAALTACTAGITRKRRTSTEASTRRAYPSTAAPPSSSLPTDAAR